MIKKLMDSPYLSLLSGAVLLITGGHEVVGSLEEVSVGAHHGVAFYGLISTIKSVKEIFEGVEKVDEAKVKIKSK